MMPCLVCPLVASYDTHEMNIGGYTLYSSSADPDKLNVETS